MKQYTNRLKKLLAITGILLTPILQDANAAIVWGISVTHYAQAGGVIYAEDSLSTVYVTELDYRSKVDYTNSLLGGAGEIHIRLLNNKLLLTYAMDYTTGGTLGNIQTDINIIPYAPLGDDMQIDVTSSHADLPTTNYWDSIRLEKGSYNANARRIENISLQGKSSNYYYYNTINVGGVEYGRLFQNYNNGYTHYRTSSHFTGYNNPRSLDASFIIKAKNLSSVPEPTSLLLVAISGLTLLRRKR